MFGPALLINKDKPPLRRISPESERLIGVNRIIGAIRAGFEKQNGKYSRNLANIHHIVNFTHLFLF